MTLDPQQLYHILLKKFGHLHWWPMDHDYHKDNRSDPRFEVIIGAILTQNTAWSNVEKAIENLKRNTMLNIKNIVQIDELKLQEMIRPSGYFRQKALRLKTCANHFETQYNGNFDAFFNRDINDIRMELLSLNGIGPETADSILLYAGHLPVFVVDAYTKRLCKRLPLNTLESYDEIQKYFEKKLKDENPPDTIVSVYNELHALIVILAKEYCRQKPRCKGCPLENHCVYRKELL
jgi:endonuclease-3 related protein